MATLVALAGCSSDGEPRETLTSVPGPSDSPDELNTAMPRVTPTNDSDVTPQVTSTAPTVTPPPRRARIWLSIPAIGLDRLRVVQYRGTADDLPGTHIQDRGAAATPRGPRGGVRPGEVGNFVVTAHRTTAGRPFGDLPSVRVGEHVLVESAGLVYDYRVTRTMTISFRSERGRLRQSAPVPGRLGVEATRPMITLSTCATPEDHAAGNYWFDALGNPEHRIDKVGVLVDVRPA
jgi:sortase A